jgi:hypothetical protein
MVVPQRFKNIATIWFNNSTSRYIPKPENWDISIPALFKTAKPSACGSCL